MLCWRVHLLKVALSSRERYNENVPCFCFGGIDVCSTLGVCDLMFACGVECVTQKRGEVGSVVEGVWDALIIMSRRKEK